MHLKDWLVVLGFGLRLPDHLDSVALSTVFIQFPGGDAEPAGTS